MDAYDAHAAQYAAYIRSRDAWGFSAYLDLVVPALLGVVGEVRRRRVLDACCGEGYFTRLLAARGARITGIDVSPNLIALAREIEAQEKTGITYLLHDLTQPLPQYAEHFDLVTCNLGLNDVADYVAFIRNVASMLRDQGAVALSMNNPYSAPLRNKVESYFDSGAAGAYEGLASGGVPALYHHRTMEEYFRAFRESGLYLRTYLDLKPAPEHLASGSPRPREYYRFPFFTVLELVKLERN